MLKHRVLTLAISVIISAPSIVLADPLTYDFTGTLNSPINGSTLFFTRIIHDQFESDRSQSRSDLRRGTRRPRSRSYLRVWE